VLLLVASGKTNKAIAAALPEREDHRSARQHLPQTERLDSRRRPHGPINTARWVEPPIGKPVKWDPQVGPVR
jgi:hypothetical protein